MEAPGTKALRGLRSIVTAVGAPLRIVATESAGGTWNAFAATIGALGDNPERLGTTSRNPP
jgi:hypothetical protein